MGKRLHNPNLAKKNRSYRVDEAASLYKVHKGTVRNWISAGLLVLNDKHPMLIPGDELAAFHRARRKKNKRPCKPGEMYCLKCRAPKLPDGGMVDYQPVTEKIWNLVAICPDCYSIMNQCIGLTKLALIRGKTDITLTLAQPHIVESNQPSVNSDLNRSITT